MKKRLLLLNFHHRKHLISYEHPGNREIIKPQSTFSPHSQSTNIKLAAYSISSIPSLDRIFRPSILPIIISKRQLLKINPIDRSHIQRHIFILRFRIVAEHGYPADTAEGM